MSKPKCEVCPPGSNCPGPQFTTLPDDPHFDGTDGAHPAWWRGYDRGFIDAARCLERTIVEPMRDLREASEQSTAFTILRLKVATLAINDGCLRADVAVMRDSRDDWHRVADERSAEIVRLDRELTEAKRALSVFAERARREGQI